jgi:hypothetical protein
MDATTHISVGGDWLARADMVLAQCWGSNQQGQLGMHDGDQAVPVRSTCRRHRCEVEPQDVSRFNTVTGHIVRVVARN